MTYDIDGASLHEERVDYVCDGVRLVGHLAGPEATATPRPAVLVFPEWWGVTDYVRGRARQLAAQGYVAFAADMFGDGTTTDDPQEAMRLTADTRFGELGRARSRAALEWLVARPEVDAGRIAAIGFCFGGDVALELARDGADLRAAVAFHASLGVPVPAGPGDIRGKVLAVHGADDPLVPPERVQTFQDEMRAAGVDWQMATYGGAVHSFTNPDADAAGLDGVAYHAAAARRAWTLNLDFLAEALG